MGDLGQCSGLASCPLPQAPLPHRAQAWPCLDLVGEAGLPAKFPALVK